MDLLLKSQKQIEVAQTQLGKACAEYTASKRHPGETQQQLRRQQGDAPDPPPFVSATSLAILEKGAESLEEKAALVQLQGENTAATKHFLEYRKCNTN